MAIGGAARAGIFIKGGDALERLAKPGRIYLDKTGTITEGRTAVVSWSGPDSVRPFVLALEHESHHPIAAGFRSAWPDVSFERATESNHVPGGGIIGTVSGHFVVVGSPRFVGAHIAPGRVASARVFDVARRSHRCSSRSTETSWPPPALAIRCAPMPPKPSQRSAGEAGT